MAVISSENRGKFISACEKIKESLEKRHGKKFKGVGEAVRHAQDKGNWLVERNKNQLDKLISLRNILAHEVHLTGEDLAIPTDQTVRQAEKLAQILANPRRIKDEMIRHPETCQATDSLQNAALKLLEHNYSQMPVYGDGNYKGMLTTNAIARWLASSISTTSGELVEENILVQDVLKFCEDYEMPGFLKPTASVEEALNKFNAGGSKIQTLLITTDGNPSGQLQGIINQFDLVRLYQAVTA